MFEWDKTKRLKNIEKHGIDFLELDVLFDGRPIFTAFSSRDEEERFASVGLIGNSFVTVIWTLRGQKIRFISARRSRDEEKRKYCQLFGC
ncbi:MAG: BrnT family toxin [Methylomonas sp.]|jgi:uncharacterized DUF497 family protein